jgi:hypothetical protein
VLIGVPTQEHQLQQVVEEMYDGGDSNGFLDAEKDG